MIILKKYIKIVFLLVILTIFYLYIANITLTPKSITLLQGEKLELATLWGISIKKEKTSNPNINVDEDGIILETSGSAEENQISEVRKSKYEFINV